MLAAELSRTSETAQLATLCKALGDPLRLDIMRLLQRDSYGVLELCEIFDIQQPSMSHHLKVLAKAELVTTRREGNTLFYRRSTPVSSAIGRRAELLLKAIDDCELPAQYHARLEKLQTQRSEQSRLFFQENAERFRQQQDLIASFRDYGSTIEDLLESRVGSGDVCIEVGAGEGDLLPHLADQFERVVAVDVSTSMLERAKEKTAGLDLSNIEFILSEPKQLDFESAADLVSCNMVLHHVASPSSLVGDMARLIRPGGYLLITDLCQHDQDWARTSCGDQWLGFETDELDHWTSEFNLVPSSHQYLALRNGFRVQLSLYESIA
jgi:ubiquinone/menaquinone biosynthesis C-methylase UbiE/DNA-binding transcriptional ArsR family regulator